MMSSNEKFLSKDGEGHGPRDSDIAGCVFGAWCEVRHPIWMAGWTHPLAD